MKWDELPRIASHKFTWENSGQREGEAPPYSIDDKGELKAWFSPFTPIGWTENPPFPPNYPCIAIMFEDQDFNTIWWHFLDPRDTGCDELPPDVVLEPEDDGMGWPD